MNFGILFTWYLEMGGILELTCGREAKNQSFRRKNETLNNALDSTLSHIVSVVKTDKNGTRYTQWLYVYIVWFVVTRK